MITAALPDCPQCGAYGCAEGRCPCCGLRRADWAANAAAQADYSARIARANAANKARMDALASARAAEPEPPPAPPEVTQPPRRQRRPKEA